jgi:hypothetical protein
MTACMRCKRFQNGGWCYWGNEVSITGFNPIAGEEESVKSKAFPISFLNGSGECKHFQPKGGGDETKK